MQCPSFMEFLFWKDSRQGSMCQMSMGSSKKIKLSERLENNVSGRGSPPQTGEWSERAMGEQSNPDTRRCKGPEVGAWLVFSGNRVKARVAGVKTERGR